MLCFVLKKKKKATEIITVLFTGSREDILYFKFKTLNTNGTNINIPVRKKT